jgi:cell division septation protein DedD
MTDIEKYIADLLYSHDCVIVPGFGGFIANYAPAKVNAARHLFSPPSKHIVFNKNLKNNDGLLANYIAFSQKVSYSSALSEIEKYVAALNDKLKRGEQASIGMVGLLFLDAEKNIQFEQSSVNFLLDSFGMAEFHSPAVKPEKVIKRIEKAVVSDSPKVVSLNANKQFNYKKIAALAASFSLVAGIFWVSLKTDFVQNIDYASLNPFANKPSDTIFITTNTTEQIETPNITVDTVANSTEQVEESESTVDVEEKTETTAAVNESAPVVEEEKGSVASNEYFQKKYHIVTGCFQIEDNAKNFVQTLSDKNIESSIIGKNNRDLYVVSSGGYNDYRQAVQALATIKASQPGAWLYKASN